MKKVNDIMTSPAKYCSKDETLQYVSHLMAENNIGSLPVLDSDEKVVGMITDRDICLAIGKNNKKKTSELTVGEAMSTKVHTCTPEDDISSVLKIMRTKQIGRLPVVDKKHHLKGIITLMNVMKNAHDGKVKEELEYEGNENVIKTLYALAERNSKE